MNRTVVTIITPFFNSSKYFRETIDSVIAQTFTMWEMICVDDGSEDNSPQIVQEYSKLDDRIKLLRRDGGIKGPSHCRNIGILAAKGEYCMFLDSDDLLSPTCLEERVRAIEKNSCNFVVFPMASFTDNVNKATIFSHLGAKHVNYYFASSISAWPVTSSMIRRCFLNEIKGFDESLIRLEDVEFHLRALLYAQGDFRIFDKHDADCFYRISSIQNRFVLSNFEASQKPVNDFIKKVLIFKKDLTDNKLLSRSFLVLLLNAIYIQAVIKMKNGELQPISYAKIEPYLMGGDKWIYLIVRNVPLIKMRIVLSAIIRKLVLRLL